MSPRGAGRWVSWSMPKPSIANRCSTWLAGSCRALIRVKTPVATGSLTQLAPGWRLSWTMPWADSVKRSSAPLHSTRAAISVNVPPATTCAGNHAPAVRVRRSTPSGRDGKHLERGPGGEGLEATEAPGGDHLARPGVAGQPLVVHHPGGGQDEELQGAAGVDERRERLVADAVGRGRLRARDAGSVGSGMEVAHDVADVGPAQHERPYGRCRTLLHVPDGSGADPVDDGDLTSSAGTGLGAVPDDDVAGDRGVTDLDRMVVEHAGRCCRVELRGLGDRGQSPADPALADQDPERQLDGRRTSRRYGSAGRSVHGCTRQQRTRGRSRRVVRPHVDAARPVGRVHQHLAEPWGGGLGGRSTDEAERQGCEHDTNDAA